VSLFEKRRKANIDDRYPIDADMKSVIIRRLLMEHYSIELQTPVDEKNDGIPGSSGQERLSRVQNPK